MAHVKIVCLDLAAVKSAPGVMGGDWAPWARPEASGVPGQQRKGAAGGSPPNQLSQDARVIAPPHAGTLLTVDWAIGLGLEG